MTLYRIDRFEPNPADPEQQLGFTDWMGGPTLAVVRGALVTGTDQRRSARVTGEPDSFFSIPAQVSLGGKTVRGWLGCDEGVYVFHPNAYT